MAKRIASLQPGDKVTIKFHRGYGYAQEIGKHKLVSLEGEGAELKANFETVDYDPRVLGGQSQFWQAYRLDGHWCTGDFAQKLSIIA